MTGFQKTIKYLSIAFAIFLTVSIVGGILSVFSVFLGSNAVGDMKTYELTRPPLDVVYRYPYEYTVDIDVNAAELIIKNSDTFCVKSNIKDLSVKETDDGIVIKTEKKLLGSYNAVVELYIPDDNTDAGAVCISEMNVDIGAGEITLDGEELSIQDLNLNLGAGEIDIKNAEMSNADIDCGAGQISVNNCRFVSSLKTDLCVGETELSLSGSKDDYAIEIDKGLGEAKIDGKKVKDGYSYDEGGECELEVSSGVGEVKVTFGGK